MQHRVVLRHSELARRRKRKAADMNVEETRQHTISDMGCLRRCIMARRTGLTIIAA